MFRAFQREARNMPCCWLIADSVYAGMFRAFQRDMEEFSDLDRLGVAKKGYLIRRQRTLARETTA